MLLSLSYLIIANAAFAIFMLALGVSYAQQTLRREAGRTNSARLLSHALPLTRLFIVVLLILGSVNALQDGSLALAFLLVVNAALWVLLRFNIQFFGRKVKV